MAVIYDLKAPKGTVPAIVQSDEWVVYDLRWIKPDVLMLNIRSSLKAVDGHMRTWARAVLVDAHGKNGRLTMQNEQTVDNNTSTAGIVDIQPDDPDHFLTALWRFHQGASLTTSYGMENLYYDLVQVNVKTGDSHVIQEAVRIPRAG